ncbi:MAG: ATP-binding cassette domain-containing protein, partial [Lysobacterales bacterium]
MSQKLLQVDRLTTGYRTQTGRMVKVVRNVSLEMQQGETLGLVGESGSGKTTFGMALMGYLRPGGQVMAGTVRFDGVEI